MPFSLPETARARIEEWKKAEGKPETSVAVGVDIGATNTRVGIARKCTKWVELVYVPAGAATPLLELFDEIGRALRAAGAVPSGAAIAVAGPLEAGRVGVAITNWKEDNTFKLATLPESLFPRGHTTFLNDLESCCHGILALNEDFALPTYFESLWGNSAVSLLPQNYLVMAMGTGLGVSMLHFTEDGTFHVVPMEVGHELVVSHGIASPDHSSDQALLKFLSEQLYDGKYGVENEDICSGRGLVKVYEFLRTEKDPALTDAGEIAKAAAGDANKVAKEAVFLHYKFLFRAAQNSCVGLQTKGILLAGDNQFKNRDLVLRDVSRFREEFLAHPKADKWLANVPVFAQRANLNANMIGALRVAGQPAPLR